MADIPRPPPQAPLSIAPVDDMWQQSAKDMQDALGKWFTGPPYDGAAQAIKRLVDFEANVTAHLGNADHEITF